MSANDDRIVNLRDAIYKAITIAQDEAYPILGSRSKGVAARHARMLAVLQDALKQDDYHRAENSGIQP